MRLTLPHRFDFGPGGPGDDLADPATWDALRLGGMPGFAMPTDRDGYAALLDSRPDLVARAQAINAALDTVGARSVASYGVGGATMEYAMLQGAPARTLVVGEYAPRTVETLRGVLPELEPCQHNLLREPPLTADAHLMHRIDTEFTGRQWRAIFRRFAGERVLFVASEPLTGARARRELHLWRHRQGTRAGWVRTRAAQAALIRRHAATPIELHGEGRAWMLTPARHA